MMWKPNKNDEPLASDQSIGKESSRKVKIFNRMVRNAKEEQIPKISSKLGSMKRGAITKVWPKVQALWELARDPKADWKPKASAIGALIYLVSPIDAIPDVIPFGGLIDDAAVIAFAFRKIRPQLQPYIDAIEERGREAIIVGIEKLVAPIGENEIKTQSKMVMLSLLGAIGISAIAIALNEYFIIRNSLDSLFGLSAATLYDGYRAILVITGLVSITYSMRHGYMMYTQYQNLPDLIQDGVRGGAVKSVLSFIKSEKWVVVQIASLLAILLCLYNIFWNL